MQLPLVTAISLLGLYISPVHSLGEGVLDVDSLTKIFLGVGNMFTNDLKTIDVQQSRLRGRWFQMYKAAINFDVFRTNMFCPVAYFKDNPVMGPDGFSVEEGYRVIAKDGPIETYKRDVTKVGPGKFWMYTEEYFYPAQFYIIKIGPELPDVLNDTDPYEYIVATDANRLALMVYARDPVKFYADYNTEVLSYLEKQRFGGGVFWNEPRAIYQGSDCQWPTEQEVFARRVLKSQQKYAQAQTSQINPLQAVQGILNAQRRQ